MPTAKTSPAKQAELDVFAAARGVTKKMTDAQAIEIFRAAYKAPAYAYGGYNRQYTDAWDQSVREFITERKRLHQWEK